MKGQKKMENKLKLFGTEKFSEEINKKLIQTKMIWLWISAFLITGIILSLSAIGTGVSYSEGDIATEPLIYEGATMTYTSEVARKEAEAKIKSGVNDVYTVDTGKMDAVTEQIDSFLEDMNAVKQEKNHDSKTAKEIYAKLFAGTENAASYESALNELSMDRIESVTGSVRTFFTAAYTEGIKDGELDAFKDKIDAWLSKESFTGNERRCAEALISLLPIEANYILDQEETEAVTARRIAEIEPKEVTIRSGQKIVDNGTEITAEQMEALQQTGMLTNSKSPAYFIGIFLYALMMYFLLFLFCKKFYPFYAFEKNGILLVNTVICGFLLLCQIIMFVSTATNGILYSVLGYLMPLPAVALIFTAVTNQRFAFTGTVFASLLMGVIVINQPIFLFAALIAAIFTVYTVGRLRERYQVVSFGMYLGIAYVLVIFVFGMLGEQSINTVSAGAIVGFIGGLLSSFIALGIIPLLENTLQTSTPMKLMELSSTSHPLLKRMIKEAPGTYYHSILVANLAEAAADAIGADSLLSRVAAYYHDIGKMERPAYFTENQDGKNNPHDKINPSLSALILVSHVKDGVDFARNENLPEDVIDIIEEHHGTSLIRYFYHKAKEADETVSEEDFSYPFRKPQTKESAIIMMADCVQAALQSMPNLTRGERIAKIHELITNRLNEGQFEECNLTFRDLHIIQDAFVAVYDGLDHQRIKYPDARSLAKNTSVAETVVRAAEKAGIPPKEETDTGKEKPEK